MEPLSKEKVALYLKDMIELSAQLEGDYWKEENYTSDLNRKWELSYCLIGDGKMNAFMIVSDKGVAHHLHRIVVRDSFQGKGLGKLFLDKLLTDARSAGKEMVTLKVNPANTKAIKVYEHYGFVIQGKDKENLLYSYKF